jgi:hypothetical protein
MVARPPPVQDLFMNDTLVTLAIGRACPGPALTSLGAGAPWAAVFVGAMVLGLALVRSRA